MVCQERHRRVVEGTKEGVSSGRGDYIMVTSIPTLYESAPHGLKSSEEAMLHFYRSLHNITL